jgi:ribosome biogenesis GTPase A
MAINWFPGHMHKARKEIHKALDTVDVVIEILDARIPFSSSNPFIAKFKAERPIIKILNKADLADPVITEQWQHYLEQDSAVKTLAICANQDSRSKTLTQLCQKLAPKKAQSDKAVHAMVMGIPNVGKSTLINALAGRSIANEPAVTKRQQKIYLNEQLTLSDTPGILWPKLEPESCGYRLAATGAIRDTAMEYEEVALFTLAFLRQHYPALLQTRFKLNTLHDDNNSLLDAIGSRRGCLRSGGLIDRHQAATIVLQDLRAGKIGPITLETPAMMEQEMSEFRAMIAARKAAEEAEGKPKDEESED